MANAILNSSLTGDADFAGAVFGSSDKPEPAPVETTQQDNQNDVPRGTNDDEKTTTQEAPEEEKKVAKVREPDKKSKITKDQVEATLKKATTKSADSSLPSDQSENDSTVFGQLPKNPNFDDKPISETPEGDDYERGISSWKEIKSEMKKAREERDRLRAELEAARDGVNTTKVEEISSLQKELNDYREYINGLNQELKIANFERSPEYVENIKKPLSSIQNDVKSLADANEVDFHRLWDAMTEPDIRKRSDGLENLLGDFKRVEQLEIVKLTEKFHNLRDTHERYQSESEHIQEQFRARKAQEENQFIERERHLQKTFSSNVWNQMQDRYDFLKEVEGQEEWNSNIKFAQKAAAETNLDILDTQSRSSILARAAVVPFLESAINHYSTKLQSVTSKKDAEISELRQQLKAAIGATPGLGSSDDNSDDDDSDTSDLKNFTNFGASIMGRR